MQVEDVSWVLACKDLFSLWGGTRLYCDYLLHNVGWRIHGCSWGKQLHVAHPAIHWRRLVDEPNLMAFRDRHETSRYCIRVEREGPI